MGSAAARAARLSIVVQSRIPADNWGDRVRPLRGCSIMRSAVSSIPPVPDGSGLSGLVWFRSALGVWPSGLDSGLQPASEFPRRSNVQSFPLRGQWRSFPGD